MRNLSTFAPNVGMKFDSTARQNQNNKQMKKLISVFLSLCAASILLAQQDLVEQANEYYTLEEYTKAVELYDSVVAMGLTSSEVYYNLGNAFYKMGQIAPCILNYERALQLAPDDEDITYNLELVQQHVVDEIEAVDVFFMTRTFRRIRASQSSDAWARLSLVSFALTLCFMLFFFLSRSVFLKRTGFYLSVILMLVSVLSFSFSSKAKRIITAHESAIIFAPTVTVTSSPNETGTKIFVLHEGTKVSVMSRLTSWVEIMLSDGNKGWVKADALEEI